MRIDEHDSLYKMAVSNIEKDIVASNYSPGQRYCSMRKIAKKNGVSMITAIRAVKELQNKGILQSVKRQGLFVSEVPQIKPLNIHYLLRRDTAHLSINPFHSEIMAGARQQLQEAQIRESNFHLSPYNAFSNNLEQEIEALVKPHPNSMIILAGRLSADVPQILSKLKLPFVMTGYYSHSPGLKLIKSDTFNGGKMIVEHLCKLGHKKMLYLHRRVSDQINTTDERLEGTELAASKSNVRIDIKELPGMDFEDGLAATTALIPFIKKNKITAVICFNDDTAAGAIHALSKSKLKIPEDISVTGYDDFPIARQIYPPLTTIKVNRFAMGKIAARTLLDFNNGRETAFSMDVLPETLVERESAGSAPQA